MASRGKSVTVTYTAYDSTTSKRKTGDVGNHTLRWIKDGSSAAPTNAAAEVDATNAPGEYKLTLTAAEATCDFGTLTGFSVTANVEIVPTKVTFENLPTAAPGANGGVPTVDASNQVLANVNQWLGVAPAALNNNLVQADVERWVNVIVSALVSGAVQAQVVSYAAGQDPATLVLGATATTWNTAGTIGNKINSAASAGNPWVQQVETGITTLQVMEIIAAALGGNIDGTTVYAANNPGTPRIHYTTDVTGLRTITSLTL